MAYSTSNPPRLIAQGVGAATGSLWHYTSADAIGDVDAADYFSNGKELGMKANDTVLVTDTTTPNVAAAVVSAVSAAGAATVVEGANKV